MRPSRTSTRRRFLKVSMGAACAPLVAPAFLRARADRERRRIGAIGMRYQGTVIARVAQAHADVVAIADVDREHAEKARRELGGTADLYKDYRRLLERKDIDAVTIATPDHWHTAIAAAACRSGKDVYCEKPLTLTVDEGKLLRRVVEETGAVFQVGSWQRSDHQFRLACELVRAGRIGKLRKVTVTLKENPTGGPFAIAKPPAHLDWDMWLGQAPEVPYSPERCHYTFRWWYEYSGGQMTDWGAHHIDIAQWGMGVERTGPLEVEGHAELPAVPNGYNVATSFDARLAYAGGLELHVRDRGRNGVHFEGEKGDVFVSRGALSGSAVEALRDDPLPRERFQLYSHDDLTLPPRTQKAEATATHMANFFRCIETRERPISDVWTQHRSASACHIANISMRLGRKLRWDPENERFAGDEEANGLLRREQRKPYEIET